MERLFLFIYTHMKNNILLIGATHGNEQIGVRACTALEQVRPDFDWIIGNPRASKLNQRFTQADLNRSAPGNSEAPNYEERRAAELIAITKSYDITIDIHGTEKNTGLFTIITNPTRENIELAGKIDVQRIVIWPAITPDLRGPVSEFFPVGLEIECGLKDELQTQVELERVLTQFLDKGQFAQPSLEDKEIYEVYGELKGDPGIELEEFVEVNIEGETFSPLLIGQYTGAYGVTCYKLKRLTSKQALSL